MAAERILKNWQSKRLRLAASVLGSLALIGACDNGSDRVAVTERNTTPITAPIPPTAELIPTLTPAIDPTISPPQIGVGEQATPQPGTTSEPTATHTEPTPEAEVEPGIIIERKLERDEVLESVSILPNQVAWLITFQGFDGRPQFTHDPNAFGTYVDNNLHPEGVVVFVVPDNEGKATIVFEMPDGTLLETEIIDEEMSQPSSPEPVVEQTDPSECNDDDTRLEGEFYIEPENGVRRRTEPDQQAEFEGAAERNTFLEALCSRIVDEEDWVRVEDESDNAFWVETVYVSEIPIVVSTPTPTSTPRPPQETPTPTATPEVLQIEEELNRELAQAVVEEINRTREGHGLNELSAHQSLTIAGEKYAKLLFGLGYPLPFNDARLHALDGFQWDRAQREGYPTNQVADDIFGYSIREGFSVLTEAEKLVRRILEGDKGHRDVMLDPRFNHIGIGCYEGPHDSSGGLVASGRGICDINFGNSD